MSTCDNRKPNIPLRICAIIGGIIVGIIILIFIAQTIWLAIPAKKMRYAVDNTIICRESIEYCEALPQPNLAVPEIDCSEYRPYTSRYLIDLVLRSQTASDNHTNYEEPEGMRMFLVLEDNMDHKPIGHVLYSISRPHEIYVAFRGTHYITEWIQDLMTSTVDITANKSVQYNFGGQSKETPIVRVHKGFADLTNNIMDQLRPALQKHIVGQNIKHPLRICVSGHSLGAAVALLVGVHLKVDHCDSVCVYTFACPRVGNDAFKLLVDESLRLPVFRVANVEDVVPQTPLPVMPQTVHSVDIYRHVGHLVSFSANWQSLARNHTLPIYIHGVSMMLE